VSQFVSTDDGTGVHVRGNDRRRDTDERGSLFRWLEEPPGRDLSVLDGETVAIDITSTDEAEFVRIDTGSGLLRGQIIEDEGLVRNAPQTLPDGVVAAMERLDSYRRADGDGRSGPL